MAAERRVSIESLSKGARVSLFHVVVWEKQAGAQGETDVPVGETTLELSNALTKEQIVAEIKAAGSEIVLRAGQAKKERAELNKLLAKEATE